MKKILLMTFAAMFMACMSANATKASNAPPDKTAFSNVSTCAISPTDALPALHAIPPLPNVTAAAITIGKKGTANVEHGIGAQAMIKNSKVATNNTTGAITNTGQAGTITAINTGKQITNGDIGSPGCDATIPLVASTNTYSDIGDQNTVATNTTSGTNINSDGQSNYGYTYTPTPAYNMLN